ncbi:Aste57867_16363 [Aphanomyces stellatus]|uniref:Aste57867_16363 protein n=1 Tax=Aphanomyces stellatus TaxID=120398 RepID=A0A485L599_9STRA|nr:hypothetical protein As57867_016306 [Aphanomyces stellatus]VFT93139.1 Aste57867_16363 [Aphanomyces stellatus]
MSGAVPERKSPSERLPLVMNDTKEELHGPMSTSVAEEVPILMGLIVPVVFTLLNEYVPAITNIVLVGHSAADNTKEQVDAVAISSMLFNITSMSVGLGLATSMDTLCTQAFGAQNTKKFGAIFQAGVLGTGLFLIPSCILNWYSESILLFLHQDPEISAMAGTFTRYSTLGLPFLCLYELIKRLLQPHQITLPSAVVAVVANVIHISVGYYLTNFTTYGYLGAAIGRSIAYICLPLLLLPYFFWNPVHREWHLRWDWREAWANLPDFLEFGIPGMVSLVVEWGAWEILTLMAGLMQDHAVVLGVNSIIMTIISLIYMIFWGVSTAACIRVGYFLGANKPAEARLVTYVCYAITLGCCLCTGVVLFATRASLPGLFVVDRDVIERTTYAILFVIPCHMIDSMNCVTTGVLRAMGKQQIGVLVLSGAYYVVGIPAAAIFAFGVEWSIEGLWIGFTCGTTIACLAYAIQIRAINWVRLANEASVRGGAD